jgi:hypothetical protein
MVALALGAVLSGALVATAGAQSGGPYRIERSTIEAGGDRAAGGSYRSDTSAAQVEAGPRLLGGPYIIEGGVQPMGAVTADGMFGDGFE